MPPRGQDICQMLHASEPADLCGFLRLDYNHVYLTRYWHYEVAIAHKLSQMAQVYFDIDVPLTSELSPHFFTQLQQTTDYRTFLIEHLDIVAPQYVNWPAIENFIRSVKTQKTNSTH